MSDDAIVSYFTDDFACEDVAFRVVNRVKEEKLRILIIEFLISSSIYAFMTMQAKALACTTCRLVPVKGFDLEVKE